MLEVSRMFPPTPSPIPRILNEDMKIGDVQIEKGTCINISWLNIFYNEEIFEKPFDFIPERWEREDYKQKRSLTDMIFSTGSRVCIGKTFAQMEIRVMMIKLMQRYQKVEERGLNEREIDFSFTLDIKDTQVNLILRN